MKRSLGLALGCALLAGCAGNTGDDLFVFSAAAVGPADAVAGQPLDFVNDRGWHVTLTSATLHIGAVYLNQSLPVSGAQNSTCILPGTYVAEVTTSMDVDMLSPEPQPFPGEGAGITVAALTGQVWLTGGDIDAPDDRTAILRIEGTADQNGMAFSFTGTITIGSNRANGSSSSAAGANPICKQRIVSPIPASVSPGRSGRLVVRVDPRFLFTNVAFDAASIAAGAYSFPDDSSDQPSRNLYQNLHSSGPYRFEWAP